MQCRGNLDLSGGPCGFLGITVSYTGTKGVLISRRERDPQVWRKMALGIVLIAALAAPQLAALLFATEPCQGEADDDRAYYDHPIWCRAAKRRGC